MRSGYAWCLASSHPPDRRGRDVPGEDRGAARSSQPNTGGGVEVTFMKRVAMGLAVAALAAAFAPQAAADDLCINHPHTPYPIICLSPR